MNRTTLTAEIAAAAGFQLALAALLRHATERATVAETAAGRLHVMPPLQRAAGAPSYTMQES
jgi:hypothetical protein